MKKAILLIITLTFSLSVMLFGSAKISGQLSDPSGDPVSNHPIKLEVQWMNTGGETHHLLTDHNGNFRIEIDRHDDGMIQLIFSYSDCDDQRIRKEKTLRPGTSEIFVPLLYCRGNEEKECKIRLHRIKKNSGGYLVIADGMGTPPFRFEWSDGSTGDSLRISDNEKFCVTMTDGDGCTNVFCNYDRPEDDCSLTITRIPSFTTEGFYLKANFRPHQNGIRYLWNTGDTSQTIFPQEPGRYCVKAIAPDGCRAEACIWISGPDSKPDCLNAEIVVNYASDLSYADLILRYDPNQQLEFRWNTGETTDRIRVTESGVYWVVIYDRENDCVVRKRVYVRLAECEVNIRVRATPLGYYLYAYSPLDQSNEPIYYRWSTGETEQRIFVSDPDEEYCVKLINENCRTRACIIPSQADRLFTIDRPYSSDSGEEASFPQNSNKEIRGSSDVEYRQNVKLFPNPVTHNLFVKLDTQLDRGSQLLIKDIQGKTVWEEKVGIHKTKGEKIGIDVNHLSPGTYILIVLMDNQMLSERFIVK